MFKIDRGRLVGRVKDKGYRVTFTRPVRDERFKLCGYDLSLKGGFKW